jgi:uncharacterized protein (DUF433 family)
MNLAERITIDPDICHGKPCIRGLRYPVEMILELLSSGMTPEEILSDYEDLERDDILAALSFAARLSQVKRIEPALETSHTALLSEKALREDWSRPEEDETWSHLRQVP